MRIPFLIPLLLTAGPVFAGMDDIIADFSQAEVIILGEIHDNPHHHLIQSDITAAIQPSAIVFEMFTPEQAGVINTLRWEGAGLGSLSDDFEWHKSGWPAFGNYARILEADPEGVIYGATVPIDDVRDAVFEGAAVVFGLGAEIYGLDQDLPPDVQTAREANQLTAHCNLLPESALAGMVQAQRLRDAMFADAVLRALDEVGPPVIVITGNGHAREDWGIPSVLKIAAPGISVVTLGQFESIPDDIENYTHILLSNAIDRKDPCLALRG